MTTTTVVDDDDKNDGGDADGDNIADIEDATAEYDDDGFAVPDYYDDEGGAAAGFSPMPEVADLKAKTNEL